MQHVSFYGSNKRNQIVIKFYPGVNNNALVFSYNVGPTLLFYENLILTPDDSRAREQWPDFVLNKLGQGDKSIFID